ncbi:MAG: MarC family protein [Candidatus Omnitrophota bacterium]|jgi:multiple antibiotic resistance protein|nr:MarC family protein [Candidatus Omnitrophota bacterium]MDD5537492.1 MarC family protein [Candidatus Omnitrophota bacterium]
MLINILKPYLVAFVPIFLAVDIIGTVPIYLGMTENLSNKQKRRLLAESILTATLLAVVFGLLGKLILRGLGITIDDFRIAGGILLFIISVYLLLPGKSRDFINQSLYEDIGICPLATPLITGPAVLVTTMMFLDAFGALVTMTSLILNMLLAWLVLRFSDVLITVLGKSGVKAISKISYIFLAAIGVMIIRLGVVGFIYSLK